jgi:uncharacterized protein YggE
MVTQAIQRTTGINVFGSHLLRVDPDYATLDLWVTRTEKLPNDAFEKAREGAAAVRAFLTGAKLPERDVRTSHVTLAEATEIRGGQQHRVGYRASIGFQVIVDDLERLEALLAGVVDAGVDRIQSVALRTKRLRDLRAEARKEAFAVARTKALLFAEAAGVRLGNVLHVEDLNSDTTRTHASSYFAPAIEEPAERSPVNPGAIAVTAAVMVCFAILV